MQYLFNRWDKLKEKLANKYIILFLDYDGTLTPIVENPKEAIFSEKTKELLKKISNNSRLKLAFISGRTLKDIKNRIGLRNVIYSGNHGLEIEGPEISFKATVFPRYLTILKKIKSDLKDKLSSVKGVFVEDKGLSLSLHYRLVDKKNVPKVKTVFYETIILYLVKDKVKIKTGKMVLEVRPPLEWDKGKVVLWLLAKQKFTLKEKTFVPIYIGDDRTDEDAFRVLKKKGLTIFVGGPKSSYAEYYLKNTNEVKELLKMILEI